jgi:4-hydroxybenzoate polyprenyltransferase/phosphoserine phosphatase
MPAVDRNGFERISIEELSLKADVAPPSAMLPIVVDLDETLILTDTLYEQVAIALFRNPLALVRALPRLAQGRAALKSALAHDIDLSSVTLPIREDLVAWLKEQAAAGREIHLCSAANQKVVDALAARLGIFKTAIGSDTANLKGRIKADYLARAFPQGFVYAGDSRADLHVWKIARGIILAGASQSVAKDARALGKPVEAEFNEPPLGIKDCLKAFRVHHWSKNVLIFVPLILSHTWTDPASLLITCLGLVCLLMVTSATYLLNDVADLDADRNHWSKRQRAIASGRLPIQSALFLAGAWLVAAFVGAVALSLGFALALAAYLVLTLAYSFGLKRVPLLDTLIIGVLFTTRLVMGIALLNQPYSEWLLTFSTFFFVSLAIAKRHTEIIRAGTTGSHSLASRGYQVEDGALTLVLGVATAVASLLIMVLFIVDEVLRRTAYTHPKVLWGVPIVLSIWVGRIWLLAHRGQMSDDPVSFALRDRVSLGLGAVLALLFVVAL